MILRILITFFACYFLGKRELHRPGALSPHQHTFDMSVPPFSTKE